MRKFWIFAGLLLVACGGGSSPAQPKAASIHCTAAYRTSVELGIERQETLILTDRDTAQSVSFSDMVFHTAYNSGESDNERNLRLWVTDKTGTTVYQSQLYQFNPDSGPQNQFVGSHGFTGLTYTYAPDSLAELQFWCEAN